MTLCLTYDISWSVSLHSALIFLDIIHYRRLQNYPVNNYLSYEYVIHRRHYPFNRNSVIPPEARRYVSIYPIACSIIAKRNSLSAHRCIGHFNKCYASAWKESSVFPWSWWRHQMETFSELLALCARNSPVTGEFPSQRLVMFSFICA